MEPSFAADLYAAFLADVLDASVGLQTVEVHCLVHPATGQDVVSGLAPSGVGIGPQSGADLGERMAAAVEALGRSGRRPVLLRNSDSPDLPGGLIEEGAATLAEGRADVVLGPDLGGGYYLVGLSAPCPELFRRVPMSTATMYQETRALARARGLRVHELQPWRDVDEVQDLVALAVALAAGAEGGPCPRTRALLRVLAQARASGVTRGLVRPGATLPVLPVPD